MPNRMALAPLTNLQSHDDGCISEDEFAWLVKRAAGGFGMVMTCAATVHPLGKGFPRQLGVHDDAHLPGLERLARALRAGGALSSVQLQHSGMRSPRELIPGAPVGVVDDPGRGVRGLSTGEVEQAVEDFILAGSAPSGPASTASRCTAPTAISSASSSTCAATSAPTDMAAPRRTAHA